MIEMTNTGRKVMLRTKLLATLAFALWQTAALWAK